MQGSFKSIAVEEFKPFGIRSRSSMDGITDNESKTPSPIEGKSVPITEPVENIFDFKLRQINSILSSDDNQIELLKDVITLFKQSSLSEKDSNLYWEKIKLSFYNCAVKYLRDNEYELNFSLNHVDKFIEIVSEDIISDELWEEFKEGCLKSIFTRLNSLECLDSVHLNKFLNEVTIIKDWLSELFEDTVQEKLNPIIISRLYSEFLKPIFSSQESRTENIQSMVNGIKLLRDGGCGRIECSELITELLYAITRDTEISNLVQVGKELDEEFYLVFNHDNGLINTWYDLFQSFNHVISDRYLFELRLDAEKLLLSQIVNESEWKIDDINDAMRRSLEPIVNHIKAKSSNNKISETQCKYVFKKPFYILSKANNKLDKKDCLLLLYSYQFLNKELRDLIFNVSKLS